MKKALALVLALVLALSMGVSAFALDLEVVELVDQTPEAAGKTKITVVDAIDEERILYTSLPGTYYIALEDKAYTDVKVTSNGCVDAELVEYDPEKMIVDGMEITYTVYNKDGVAVTEPCSYKDALSWQKHFNDSEEVTTYTVKCDQNVNIIKVTVADNFSAHYEEGTITVEAKLDKKDYKGVLTVINDVVIFEYEQVKWAAANNADGAALQLFDGGYSDFLTSKYGYSINGEYDEKLLRERYLAAVISTTAFRAIEGKDITVNIADTALVDEVRDVIDEAVWEELGFDISDYKTPVFDVEVTLYDVAAGQKGVNFFVWGDVDWNDKNGNEEVDFDDTLNSVSFGFKGDQVVKGAYEITIELPITYYHLREAFGVKVEEDDIITYYIVDENGKVVGNMPIDYMTADLTENVKFIIKGENNTLGWYTLCLEVPAAEDGEENPNTGAESVVGVVAALAVVSVATAAAVSLKK